MGGAFVARGALQAMKQMEGYLSFGVHGAHSHGIDEPSAVIKVIDDQHLGEFEIAFCSTACLRGFLNTSVDALEQQLKKAAHKNRAT